MWTAEWKICHSRYFSVIFRTELSFIRINIWAFRIWFPNDDCKIAEKPCKDIYIIHCLGGHPKLTHRYPERRIHATTNNFPRSWEPSLAWLKVSQGGDALTRMQQQLDTIVSTMTKGLSKPEATVSTYQFSPQHTTALDNKVTHLEGKIDQLKKMVGNRPQEYTGPKIAAFQTIATHSADEELRYLQKQVRQLRGINWEEHCNAIAAYQPSTRGHNRFNSESEELQHLKEEIRLLKLAQRGPQQQQPQQFQNRLNYGSQDAFQERMMNEIRRMQARVDGFVKVHANSLQCRRFLWALNLLAKATCWNFPKRQEQPRVRTREGRPVCDICGRVGHVRQNCYARINRRNQYQILKTLSHAHSQAQELLL